MSLTLIGYLAVVFAGASNGSFAVPAKRKSAWTWQHVWLTYIVTAYCVLPLLITALSAPAAFPLLEEHALITVRVVLLGACFGVGVLFFGASLERLGISATNALVNGVAVLFGSIGPVLFNNIQLGRPSWLVLLAGLLLTLAGILSCSFASVVRDGKASHTAQKGRSFSGIVFAVLSGALGAILNIALVQNAPLVRAAKDAGMGDLTRALVVWAPILFGAFLVNVAYSGYQITRARAWSVYRVQELYPWVQGISMGLLWFSALAIYGIGVLLMHHAGPVFGWVIYVGGSILTSTLWGAILGEWDGAPIKAKRFLYVGAGFLLVALAGLSGLSMLA